MPACGQQRCLPGHARHEHEHEQHGIVLRRYMPAEGIKYEWGVANGAATKHPDQKVCVLDAVVQKCIVQPALHKFNGLHQ